MPPSIAPFAPSRTASGTSVSQTPWARLMPLTFSHSIDITRISDCTVRAARLLMERLTMHSQRLMSIVVPGAAVSTWSGRRGVRVACNPNCLLVDLSVLCFAPLETDFGGAAGRSELYFHLSFRFTQLSRQDTQVTVAVRVGLDLGLMYLAFRIAAESNLCFPRKTGDLHKGQLKISHEPYHAHLAIMIAAFNWIRQDRNEGMIVALL